jgi:hypothetical protein
LRARIRCQPKIPKRTCHRHNRKPHVSLDPLSTPLKSSTPAQSKTLLPPKKPCRQQLNSAPPQRTPKGKKKKKACPGHARSRAGVERVAGSSSAPRSDSKSTRDSESPVTGTARRSIAPREARTQRIPPQGKPEAGSASSPLSQTPRDASEAGSESKRRKREREREREREGRAFRWYRGEWRARGAGGGGGGAAAAATRRRRRRRPSRPRCATALPGRRIWAWGGGGGGGEAQ